MDQKYILGTEENKQWQRSIRENLLEFGKDFASPSGASYYLGDDGKPWKERARETYITARMAHVYSIGCLLGRKGSRDLSEAAIRGLRTELWDKEHDGWYAAVNSDGTPAEGKLCYAHAFVILAATSGMMVSAEGAEELLEHALKVYDRFFWNEEEGLAVDNWDNAFSQLDTYRGLNANMHSVEAFLAVADVAGKEEYRTRAGRVIDSVIRWAEANEWRIPEHYTDAWVPDLDCNMDNPADPFKPYGATPGHGIEWARLITQWAVSTFGEKDNRYIKAAEELFLRAAADAWNADGAPGICYTTDWKGSPVVHDRMHWTLAEAINTSAVLYSVTGKQKYKDLYGEFVQYLDDKVLDKVNGSWYHQLDQNNQVLDTVWPGKADLYHAFQSTLIPYADPGLSICPAVAAGKIKL